VAKQVNEFTLAMESIQSEIKAKKKEAGKSRVVPFGLERLNSRDAATRFKGMNEAEKREFIQRTGIKETVKLMRGKNA
jgi:hypothetical protein